MSLETGSDDAATSNSTESVLNPTVKRLGLVSFFADVSSEMLYPITPLFVTTVLGASMTSLGLIEGVAEGIASLLKTYSGFWSDRIQKRKPFVWGGYLLAAVAKPITGMATAWTGVLFARALDRTGKGLRGAPRDAMLAESVSADRLGAAFGWHRLMDTAGAAVGPLLAILFLQYSSNLRLIYFWAFVPGILSVAVALGIREKRANATGAPQVRNKPSWGSMFSLPGNFKYYLVVWGVFSLVNSSDVFLLLRVKQAGVSLTETILLYCFYNLFYAVASPSLGGLSDRIGRKKLLIFGLLVFAAVYGGFVFVTQRWQFWMLFAIYGLYMAATDGVGKAFAIDLVDKTKKATAVGYLGTVTGLATLVASTMAGVLWDHWGFAATFIYAVAGALLAILLLAFLPAGNSAR